MNKALGARRWPGYAPAVMLLGYAAGKAVFAARPGWDAVLIDQAEPAAAPRRGS